VITLVLGGTRSGKSEVAEALAGDGGTPVTYVATGQATDEDMAARIARHRARRSAAVLVDSLGTWVAGDAALAPATSALCAALRSRPGDTVVVSEEVGLGVHPPTEVGRRFADALGELNRAVADEADRVLLVVAGRVLPLDRPAEAP
jgi:adenosyl cobinamide kinase/adenosyl cobinamide phosphate guanylyltransferase